MPSTESTNGRVFSSSSFFLSETQCYRFRSPSVSIIIIIVVVHVASNIKKCLYLSVNGRSCVCWLWFVALLFFFPLVLLIKIFLVSSARTPFFFSVFRSVSLHVFLTCAFPEPQTLSFIFSSIRSSLHLAPSNCQNYVFKPKVPGKKKTFLRDPRC